MIADDVYRSRLQSTIAALRYWVPTIADAAHVEQIDGHQVWKMAVKPLQPAACPFELMLRSDQHYDISVAGEIFEDLPVASLDIFVPLVEAIAEGRVIQRRTESVVTGAPFAIETRIMPASGEVWSARRELPAAALVGAADAAVCDRHFIPYRRR